MKRKVHSPSPLHVAGETWRTLCRPYGLRRAGYWERYETSWDVEKVTCDRCRKALERRDSEEAGT